MNEIQYAVVPIYGLHNVAISKVRVLNERDENTCTIVQINPKRESVIINKSYLFETKAEAIEQLRRSVLEFKAKLDYSLDKAIQTQEAEDTEDARTPKRPDTGRSGQASD